MKAWGNLFSRQSWRLLLGSIGLGLLLGCGSGDPFTYVKVTGKVTYDDGTTIPAQDLKLFFFPIDGTIDAKTHARPGQAIVECATGEFAEITSHKFGDGLAQGKYKVVVSSAPAEVVPRECTKQDKTPLEVDTANVPFDIKVPKPKK